MARKKWRNIMMKMKIGCLALLSALLLPSTASAQIAGGGGGSCPSFAGTNSFDSTSELYGDPFQGGAWGNSRNGGAYAVRTFRNVAYIRGIHVGSAGSDITTNGSRITITLVRPDNSRFIALDLHGAAINRGFSPGNSGTVVGPLTIDFPEVATKSIVVTMRGNGWFMLNRMNFALSRC